MDQTPPSPTVIPQADPGAGYRAQREEIDAAVHRALSSGWYILGEELAAFERDLQELLADLPERCGEGFRLGRREWPTDIGPVDLMCRDEEDGWIAVEIKRIGTPGPGTA